MKLVFVSFIWSIMRKNAEITFNENAYTMFRIDDGQVACYVPMTLKSYENSIEITVRYADGDRTETRNILDMTVNELYLLARMVSYFHADDLVEDAVQSGVEDADFEML